MKRPLTGVPAGFPCCSPRSLHRGCKVALPFLTSLLAPGVLLPSWTSEASCRQGGGWCPPAACPVPSPSPLGLGNSWTAFNKRSAVLLPPLCFCSCISRMERAAAELVLLEARIPLLSQFGQARGSEPWQGYCCCLHPTWEGGSSRSFLTSRKAR